MYNFYHNGECIKSLDCNRAEALNVIQTVLNSFHTLWTFSESRNNATRVIKNRYGYSCKI